MFNQQNDNSQWNFVSIVLFGTLAIVPVHKVAKFSFLRIREYEVYTKTYDSVCLEFMVDYERSNPVTRQEGVRSYIHKLKAAGVVTEGESQEMHEFLIQSQKFILKSYFKENRDMTKKIRNRVTTRHTLEGVTR